MILQLINMGVAGQQGSSSSGTSGSGSGSGGGGGGTSTTSIEFTKSTSPYHHWTVPSSGGNFGFPLVQSSTSSGHTGSYNVRYITVPTDMNNVRIYLAAQTKNDPAIQRWQQDWTYAGVEVYRPSTSSVIQTYNFSEHFNTQSTSTTSGWETTTTSNKTSTYTIGPPETVAQVSAKSFSSITTAGTNYSFRMGTSTGSVDTGMLNGLAANANISGAGNVISGVSGRYFAYIETSNGYLDYYSTVYMRSPTVNLVAGDRIYVAAQLPTAATTNSNDDCLWIGVT